MDKLTRMHTPTMLLLASCIPLPTKGTRNSWENKHFESWHKEGSRGDLYQPENKEMLKE